MTPRDDRERARKLLVRLANEGASFSVGVSLELAGMLCHIAGGDGRGVYTIKHNPTGDQLPPPWAGPVSCHGVSIDVEGPSVLLWACQEYGEEPMPVVFEEAMDVAERLDQAIARAVYNAVNVTE